MQTLFLCPIFTKKVNLIKNKCHFNHSPTNKSKIYFYLLVKCIKKMLYFVLSN